MNDKTHIIYPFLLAILVVIFALALVGGANGTSWDHQKSWNGINGSENNLAGYDLLWILGGSGGTSAQVVVTLSDGSSQTITGTKQGNGSFHFVSHGVAGATVTAATVYWNGEWVNAPLTISHTIGEPSTTTTTTEEETTTTTGENTTTTRGLTTVTYIQTDGGGMAPGPNWALIVASIGAGFIGLVAGSATYRWWKDR